MIKELFPEFIKVISRSISKAENKDQCMVCNNYIDHLENDYLYMHLPGKEDQLQELRNELQAKLDELTREGQPQC